VERIMTTTQTDISEIQQAVQRLTRREREELAEWMLNLADFGDTVAEPKVAWGGQAAPRLLSVDEYLQMDFEGSARYEYIAGEIFAMAGAAVRHGIIVGNLFANFHAQLRGGPCKVFAADTKVRLRVDRGDIFYIPDIVVACGPFDTAALNLQYLTDPRVVIEVLSPSTEAIDRREKAFNYRYAPSLEEYVLVAQRSLNVTIYRREADWMPVVLTKRDDVAEFRAAEVNMTLADIYAGILEIYDET
jgi:Uma2 family endonuclease